MTRSLLATAFLLSSIVGLEHVNAAASATIPVRQGTSNLDATDLAPTDIFLDRLQNGHIWVRITNHGPNVVQGRTAELIVVVDGGGLLTNCQLYVAPGQTQTLNTGIVISALNRTRDVTVTVGVPGMRDANPSNNTYRELVP